MALGKKAATALQASISSYKFDTSKYITLKPLTAVATASSQRPVQVTVKKAAPAKAKSNA